MFHSFLSAALSPSSSLSLSITQTHTHTRSSFSSSFHFFLIFLHTSPFVLTFLFLFCFSSHLPASDILAYISPLLPSFSLYPILPISCFFLSFVSFLFVFSYVQYDIIILQSLYSQDKRCDIQVRRFISKKNDIAICFMPKLPTKMLFPRFIVFL